MSNGDHWMPLYIGDYMAATMHLSTLEHGVYLLLLMHYWQTGPLPEDDRSLAAIVKLSPGAWNKVAPRIRKFFTSTDGALHQKRADRERDHVHDLHVKRQVAGRAGAEAKWGQPFTNPPPAKMEPKPPDKANGKCHAFAIDLPADLPPDLPAVCQPFATDFAIPQSDSDLEAEGTKEESLKTLPLGVDPAGARESAPSAAVIGAGGEADDDTPTHAEIERRRERFLRELEGAERTPAMIERIARSVRSTAVRPAGIATFRSRQDQINAICPQPKPTPHHLTPEQLAHARQLTRRLVPA